MTDAIIATAGEAIRADGVAFVMREWAHGPNEGPPVHVHHSDDEAWYVLDGSLRFQLGDRTVDAGAGTCVFVPPGVAHTFGNPGPGSARYLIITTPRVLALIDALHGPDAATPDQQAAIYRRYDSEMLV